jgi:deoxyribodipyrimidine photo-lyase
VNSIWGSSLYELEDAPFDVNSVPTVMTQFRTKMEKNCAIPNCVETFGKGHTCGGIPVILKGEGEKELPGLKDLGFDEALPEADKRAAFEFKGGEENALARVQEYIFDLDLLKTYFETRNGLIGANFSTKFSPFLAVGSVSPRYIAHQCRKYEAERVSNKSTYWVIFELTVRDFCRYFAKRFGDKIFQLDGILGKEARGRHPNSIRWNYNPALVDAWKDGTTGFPFVDANMRELKATGYMSNRGRQNVASFLALDMNQDWRYGGYWFEEVREEA